jgi:hypothetical protein
MSTAIVFDIIGLNGVAVLQGDTDDPRGVCEAAFKIGAPAVRCIFPDGDIKEVHSVEETYQLFGVESDDNHMYKTYNCERLVADHERLLALTQELQDLRSRVAELDMLEAHGVDNWEGYSDAMRELHHEDD